MVILTHFARMTRTPKALSTVPSSRVRTAPRPRHGFGAIRCAAGLLLAALGRAAAADSAGETWIAANDPVKVVRSGDWQWTNHRYAAESAFETMEDGAALEVSFHGRALIVCFDTLTPPNNYGPPELGRLDVSSNRTHVRTVRPRDSANEVTLVRSTEARDHRVRLVHRRDATGAGVRIRGFRVATEATGDLVFGLNGEKNGALVDARAILTRGGKFVREGLVRNWLTGECRLAGLPPGEGYQLEVRAAGWEGFEAASVTIQAGEETRLEPIYLPRQRDVPQDAFTFPAFGYAAVRPPGGTFRARFEGQRAEIRSVRIVRQQGPATISRSCAFAEEKAAAFYYHREGTVTIPADAPPGTYDLEITLVEQRRTRTLTSPRSISVVTEFPRDPVFVSWGHLDTWGQYQAEYVERLATIANVLAADMVLVANEGNPAYAAGALYRLEMPFVINFGNHRGPEPGPWFFPPVGVVDFGPAFSVLNFGLAWDRGTAEADQLLAARTPTRLKIINAFESNAPVRDFLDRHGIALIHYAHGPGPAVAKLGATPTIRVGKSNSESFRVIRFKDGRPLSYTYRGDATAPIPFPRGGPAPIRVTHSPANDGTNRTVTAQFHNDLEERFPEARATFIMPRGSYRVTGGRVERAIDSDDGKFTVLSVRFDLPAKTNGRIRVEPER